MLLELARRLTEEHDGDAESLEALFARRCAADADDEYLASDSWSTGGVSPTLTGDDGDILAPPEWTLIGALPTDAAAAGSDLATAGSQMIQFTELSRPIRRPRSRRKAISEAQLALFDE